MRGRSAEPATLRLSTSNPFGASGRAGSTGAGTAACAGARALPNAAIISNPTPYARRSDGPFLAMPCFISRSFLQTLPNPRFARIAVTPVREYRFRSRSGHAAEAGRSGERGL